MYRVGRDGERMSRELQYALARRLHNAPALAEHDLVLIKAMIDKAEFNASRGVAKYDPLFDPADPQGVHQTWADLQTLADCGLSAGVERCE